MKIKLGITQNSTNPIQLFGPESVLNILSSVRVSEGGYRITSNGLFKENLNLHFTFCSDGNPDYTAQIYRESDDSLFISTLIGNTASDNVLSFMSYVEFDLIQNYNNSELATILHAKSLLISKGLTSEAECF